MHLVVDDKGLMRVDATLCMTVRVNDISGDVSPSRFASRFAASWALVDKTPTRGLLPQSLLGGRFEIHASRRASGFVAITGACCG
jgi:hypothetical protein